MTKGRRVSVSALVASVLCLVAIVACTAGAKGPSSNHVATIPFKASYLVPAYFSPSGTKWQKACATTLTKIYRTVLIMNPNSGPGDSLDSAYKAAVDSCHQQGNLVIGYVATGYGKNPNLTPDSLKAQIKHYYDWYVIDGIFFDQMSNDPLTKNYYLGLYTTVQSYVRHFVVGNPGIAAATPWQVTSPVVVDVIVTFEGSATKYVSWTPPTWVTQAGSRPASSFANLVYGVRNPGWPFDSHPTTVMVCSHSKLVKGGWMDVTWDDLKNPWDSLSDSAGMNSYC